MTEADRAAGSPNPVLVECWRGEVLENAHRGAVAIASRAGPERAIGDIDRPILPRSACKMLQALALVESGAATRAGLDARHIALACGSHGGLAEHTALVGDWLGALGLGPEALLCGSHAPLDRQARAEMRAAGGSPSTLHHQCSGKHAGFLTLARAFRADGAYVEPDHPAQRMVRAAIEEVCEERVAATAIDGCSAPNHAVSLGALARALAGFARPGEAYAGARAEAAGRITAAMRAHPRLIGGPRQVATRLTDALDGSGVAKSGAAGVYTAILPERGLGIALKIDDGDQEASETAIAAVLAGLGALPAADPLVADLTERPVLNFRRIRCGTMRPAATLTP